MKWCDSSIIPSCWKRIKFVFAPKATVKDIEYFSLNLFFFLLIFIIRNVLSSIYQQNMLSCFAYKQRLFLYSFCGDELFLLWYSFLRTDIFSWQIRFIIIFIFGDRHIFGTDYIYNHIHINFTYDNKKLWKKNTFRTDRDFIFVTILFKSSTDISSPNNNNTVCSRNFI